MKREDQFEDYEMARLELINLVIGSLAYYDGTRSDESLATVIVEDILINRPDLVMRLAYPAARRAWFYPRSRLHWSDVPWLQRGGDEYGNPTVCLRVPLLGQLVVATSLRLRRIVERNDAEPVR